MDDDVSLEAEHRRNDHDAEVALQLTHTLLRVVASGDPIKSLASQLATLVHGAALIYDADGALTGAAGEAPAQLIWNEAQDHATTDQDLVIGKWRVKSRKLAISVDTHVIALASRTPALIDSLGTILLDTSERILSTIHGLQYSAHLRHRRNNQHLLLSLQDGIPPSREHRFWSRMSEFHFPEYANIRAFELARKDGMIPTEADIDVVFRQARSVALPCLAGLRRVDATSAATISGIVLDVPARYELMANLATRFNVGFSEPFSSLVGTPKAKRDAEIALRIAMRRSREGAPGSLVDMDGIDLATWLLSRVSNRALRAEVEKTLGPINGNASIVDTLVMYLASKQNIALTARQMFLHPNTVRYRIAKAEKALGEPLSEPRTLTNVTLALYEDILEAQRQLSMTT